MESKPFHQFALMPLDIRQKWQYALTAPWVLTLKPLYDKFLVPPKAYQGPTWGTSCTRYRPESPSGLSATCRESREEFLRTYMLEERLNTLEGIKSHPWIRFDRDIVHLKDLYFAGRSSGYWYMQENEFFDWPSYDGRPPLFEHLESVAMPWEFWRTQEFACLISNFFPKLKVLIFLIDESVKNAPRHMASSYLNIEHVYKEPDMRVYVPAFVKDGVGPFVKVRLNREFEVELLEMFNFHLKRKRRLGEGIFYTISDGIDVQVKGCVVPFRAQAQSAHAAQPMVERREEEAMQERSQQVALQREEEEARHRGCC